MSVIHQMSPPYNHNRTATYAFYLSVTQLPHTTLPRAY